MDEKRIIRLINEDKKNIFQVSRILGIPESKVLYLYNKGHRKIERDVKYHIMRYYNIDKDVYSR